VFMVRIRLVPDGHFSWSQRLEDFHKKSHHKSLIWPYMAVVFALRYGCSVGAPPRSWTHATTAGDIHRLHQAACALLPLHRSWSTANQPTTLRGTTSGVVSVAKGSHGGCGLRLIIAAAPC
jgi:hypothetical protein